MHDQLFALLATAAVGLAVGFHFGTRASRRAPTTTWQRFDPPLPGSEESSGGMTTFVSPVTDQQRFEAAETVDDLIDTK